MGPKKMASQPGGATAVLTVEDFNTALENTVMKLTAHARRLLALDARQEITLNTDKDGKARTLNYSRGHNVEAIAMQFTGRAAPAICDSCRRKAGPFAECVLSPIPEVPITACASCHYNSEGKRCSYRKAAEQDVLERAEEGEEDEGNESDNEIPEYTGTQEIGPRKPAATAKFKTKTTPSKPAAITKAKTTPSKPAATASSKTTPKPALRGFNSIVSADRDRIMLAKPGPNTPSKASKRLGDEFTSAQRRPAWDFQPTPALEQALPAAPAQAWPGGPPPPYRSPTLPPITSPQIPSTGQPYQPAGNPPGMLGTASQPRSTFYPQNLPRTAGTGTGAAIPSPWIPAPARLPVTPSGAAIDTSAVLGPLVQLDYDANRAAARYFRSILDALDKEAEQMIRRIRDGE